MKKKQSPFQFSNPVVYLIIGIAAVLAVLNGVLLYNLNKQSTATLPTQALLPTETATQHVTNTPGATNTPTTTPTLASTNTPPATFAPDNPYAVTEEAIQWTNLVAPTGKPVVSIQFAITVAPEAYWGQNCPKTANTAVAHGAYVIVCAKVTNTGNVPLARHSYTDNHNSKPYIFDEKTLLLPGQSYQVFLPFGGITTWLPIRGTWTAYTTEGVAVTASAEAAVDVDLGREPVNIVTTEEFFPSPASTEELHPTPAPTYTPRLIIPMNTGDDMPDLTLMWGGGRTESLWSMPEPARLTIVNFTAEWCQPCINLVMDLETFRKDYAPEDVRVIGVLGVDSTYESFKQIRKWHPAGFPILRDTYGQIRDYGFDVLPVTVIYSEDVVIQAVYTGSDILPSLKRTVDEWLASH